MTIKELIEYLKTLPEETKVKVPEVMESGYGAYTKYQDLAIEKNMFYSHSFHGNHELEIGEEV